VLKKRENNNQEGKEKEKIFGGFVFCFMVFVDV